MIPSSARKRRQSRAENPNAVAPGRKAGVIPFGDHRPLPLREREGTHGVGRVRGGPRGQNRMASWITPHPSHRFAAGPEVARKSRDCIAPTITFGARPAFGRRLHALSQRERAAAWMEQLNRVGKTVSQRFKRSIRPPQRLGANRAESRANHCDHWGKLPSSPDRRSRRRRPLLFHPSRALFHRWPTARAPTCARSRCAASSRQRTNGGVAP